MSQSSFYGGRSGASFCIVKQFDGLDIPQSADSYVYKQKTCAIKIINNENYYIYPWIEKTGNNYQEYTWGLLTLDGGIKNVVDSTGTTIGTQTVERKLAEGMRQCFEKGGETTDIVNYGEYVIIDTIIGLCDYINPDNGKIYRRGVNFDYNPSSNPLAGAEYIGQVIGPKGNTPELEMDSAENLIAAGAESSTYDMTNGLVPGKDDEGNFNDEITYAWINYRDVNGVVTDAVFGFTIPYLVHEFNGAKRSPYYQNGDIIPAGSAIGDRLASDYELIDRIDDKTHPFYNKWKVNIPVGITGQSFSQLEIYPTKAKPGTIMYSDQTLQTQVGVAAGTENIDLSNYNRNNNYILLENNNYISINDGWKLKVRYKSTNYENKQAGEDELIDIGDYNIIDSLVLSPEGILTAYYTYNDAEVLTRDDDKKLKWIHYSEESEEENQGVYIQDDGSIVIVFNNIITDPETGTERHEKQIHDKVLTWITNIECDQMGHLTISYNNKEDESFTLSVVEDMKINTGTVEGSGNQKLAVKYSTETSYNDIGQPINYILDSYVVPKNHSQANRRGHLMIYYSDPERRAASECASLIFHSNKLNADVSGWTDMGDVKGEKGNTNILHIYDTYEDIPNMPPEEIMGGDDNYIGWDVLIGDITDPSTIYHLGVYDYMDEMWKDTGVSGSDPSQIITIDPNSTSLQENGFVIDIDNVRYGDVISQGVSQKQSGNLVSYPFGAYVKHISAQQSSNNDNLEEQLMLGTDAEDEVIKTLVEPVGEDAYIETVSSTKYRVNGATDGYYTLEKTIHEEPSMNFNESINKLTINLHPKVYSQIETLYYGNAKVKVSEKTVTYTYNNDNSVDIVTVIDRE